MRRRLPQDDKGESSTQGGATRPPGESVVGSWRATVHRPAAPCIDQKDIAVAVFCASRFNRDLLVPAMHATHRIRMYPKCQVLMHPGLAPEDASGVRVLALIGPDSLHLSHTPVPVLLPPQYDEGGCPTIHACARRQSPAAQVV